MAKGKFGSSKILLKANGFCHCKSIAFQAMIDAETHMLCHCDACKVLSGGPYTLTHSVSPNLLQILSGELSKYTYKGDSGKPVHCYFCPTCGTHMHIYHQFPAFDDKCAIPTMLFEDGKSFTPELEIYGKDRLSWVQEAAMSFDMLPPIPTGGTEEGRKADSEEEEENAIAAK